MGAGVEVVSIAPNIHNQSWVVLRKLDVEVTVEELERPHPDPGYAAIRHNLLQAQREIEAEGRKEGRSELAASESRPPASRRPRWRTLGASRGPDQLAADAPPARSRAYRRSRGNS